MTSLIFAPEIFFFLAAMVMLGISMAPKADPRKIQRTALFLTAAGVIICQASLQSNGLLFFHTYEVNLFSQVFKTLLGMGLFLVICICDDLTDIDRRWHAEFYLLLFASTLAMMLLVSSVHMISIYVSLELSSYSLYVLVALRKNKNLGVPAGLKYFFIGITSSAIMLFGLALLNGATGTTYVRELVQILPGLMDHPLVPAALLFTLCGFFFKLALFPFHFWAPDVYEGATNQVTTYIATVSKVAAVAILLRLTAATGGDNTLLVHILATLSIVSMTVGNLAAIAQKDLKRLFAYSSIAHAGYVLIGILCMSPDGYAGTAFYALALLTMKMTAFIVLVQVAHDGQNVSLAQLAGLHRRSPLLAMALMLSVFGMAGIPPTIGFTAKLLVFVAAIQKGYIALVFIAMFNVVISLYYYILVVKAAYLDTPLEPMPDMNVSVPIKILTGALVTFMIIAGIFPHYLIELARAATQVLY